MQTLYYQKSPDNDGFEVMVLDLETQKVIWSGKVSELVDNNAH